MKKESVEILKRAKISSWWDSIADSIGVSDPSINTEDEPTLKKFQQQSTILAEQLEKTLAHFNKFGIQNNPMFKGEGKSTLEDAIKYLNQFSKVLNETKYKLVHAKPDEDIK